MKLEIRLPKTFETKTIRQLLEEEWLIPRKVRHFLRIRKNVAVNGERKMFHEEVQARDKVVLFFEAEDYPVPHLLLGDKKKVTVLFEDEHLIIVNKPAGIKTHPNQPDENETMLNHLASYLQEKNQTPYVVHRLDKETSGAILFAKNPIILPILSRMMEKKGIHRQYQAIVTGRCSEKEQTICKKIGRHPHDNRKRAIDERRGKPAITRIQVVKTTANQSFLNVVLETGRTHQIRVHLSSIGHAILGDPLYGKQETSSRLMLHASSLWFTHPFTEEAIVVKTPETLF